MTASDAPGQPAMSCATRSDGRRTALLAATLCLAVAPLLICWPVPALLDYPNHLARMALLMRAASGNPHPDYEVVWSFIPNLAMDLVVPWLGRWMRIETAGLLFLLAGKALLVVGAAALERTVKGRVAWAGFVAIIALWAAPFAWGFVNFEIGLGVSLIALAGWLRLTRRPFLPWLAIWHALACAALFSTHLFALGIYGWSVGICELWRWRRDEVSWGARLAITLVLALPPLALLLASRASGASIGGDVTLWSLQGKAMFGLAANGFSQVASAIVVGAAALAAYVVWRRREAAFIGAGGWLALSYAALFAVMPNRIADTQFVDIRVVVAAFFVLPAFVEIRWHDRRGPRAARAALVGLIGLTTTVAALHQASFAPTYRALARSFDQLPPRARLLLAYDVETDTMPPSIWDFPFHHAAAPAVFRRDVYMQLFTHAGMQTLQPARHLGPIGALSSGPVSVTSLAESWAPRAATPDTPVWSRDFDYLYVFWLEGRPLPGPVAEGLRPIASGPRFTLYRIEKPTKP